MGRPRMQFQVELKMVAVPLTPEFEFTYWEAWRQIGKMMFEVAREMQEGEQVEATAVGSNLDDSGKDG